MNSVQMHLALTHVPVILSLAGLGMLIVALIMKNTTLTKASYVVILIAGIATLPVFFSGEGSEEAVENLPGVSEAMIGQHEAVALWAMIAIAAAGLVALMALFSFKWMAPARIFKVLVLVLAITSCGLMAQTAHLGGQIRHTEIRNGVALTPANEASNEAGGTNNEQQEND